jgi:hypothetical protein
MSEEKKEDNVENNPPEDMGEEEEEKSDTENKEEPIKATLSQTTVEPLTRSDFPMEVVGQWTRIHARNPPKRRSCHTSFIYRKKYLYIVGGVDITERKQSDIYRIKLTSNYPEWEKIEVENMIKIAYHAGVYYKGIYYIIGGQNEELRSINTVLKFKVKSNSLLDPIEPDEKTFPKLESHTANLYNGCAYVYGGNCGRDFNKHVYCINLESGEIKNLTENLEEDKMPKGRADHSAEIQGDNLIIYGGYGPDNYYFNDVWSFNLGSNTWTQIKFGDEDEKQEEEKKENEEEKKEENKDDENKEDENKEENKEEEKKEEEKEKIDRPEGRSGQTMININGTIYIFGGKLGLIKESNELWKLDTSTPKYEIIHDTLIEQFSEEELKGKASDSDKLKKPFHWLTKREVDQRTNPLPFALKKSKLPQKKNNKENEQKKKLNNSFTEKDSKYSEQVLQRPNVMTMKKALVYTSVGDKLKDALEQLKDNEKAMVDKDSVFIIGSVPEPRDGQSCVLFEGNKLVVFGGDRNKFPFNDLFIFDTKEEVKEDNNQQPQPQ